MRPLCSPRSPIALCSRARVSSIADLLASTAALLASTSSFTLPTSPPSVSRSARPLRCSSRSRRASAAVFSSSAAVTPARSPILAVWPRTAASPRSSSFALLSDFVACSVSSAICRRAPRSSTKRYAARPRATTARPVPTIASAFPGPSGPVEGLVSGVSRIDVILPPALPLAGKTRIVHESRRLCPQIPPSGDASRPGMTYLSCGSPVGRRREETMTHETNAMSTITTKDGVEIFYKDWGQGQPIVFSHGWPLSADDWDTQMMFFVTRGYRVIAHDRRGPGRSSQVSYGHDMDHYADDLAALTSHLDLKNAIHVGHSTGGGEVAHYLGRHGESRVAKAVLISAVPPLVVKTPANPGGLPIEVIDGLRKALGDNRAQFYLDFASGPFYGFNRPGDRKSVV